MKDELTPKGLFRGLLGAAIFYYCLFAFQPLVLAEGIQDMASEMSYPDSLQKIREYHENFSSPASTTNARDPKCLDAAVLGDDAAKIQAEIAKIRMDPEVIFDEDFSPEEIFLNMVVANTDDHKTEEHRTIVLGDGQNQGSLPSSVNSMNIEVAHITVIAINFARGGSAVATSEIYLEPTQDQGRAQS